MWCRDGRGPRPFLGHLSSSTLGPEKVAGGRDCRQSARAQGDRTCPAPQWAAGSSTALVPFAFPDLLPRPGGQRMAPCRGGCACRSRPLVPSGRAGRLRRIRDPFGRGPDLAGIGYGQDGRAGGTACPARPTPGPAIGLRRNTPSNRPVCPCGMIRQNPAPLPRDFLQGQVSGPAAWRMFGAGVAGPGQGSCGSASLLPPAGAPLCRWPSGRPGSWVKGTFARFRADFAIRLHRTSPCRGNGILPRGASLAKTERGKV